MPSDLQVSNIKDLTGSNTGLSIASDGQVTISQNNPSITLGSNATFPAGHILQIVQTVKTDTTSNAGESSINFEDISGMSCSITPQTGNKVLVFFTLNLSGRDGYMASLRLLRGSDPINIGDQEGSNRTRATYTWRGLTVNVWPANTMFIDASPGGDGSTAIIYKLQWTGESGNTMYLNRTYNHVDNYYHGVSTSNITLMEVKG